jgi:hypothetical protein
MGKHDKLIEKLRRRPPEADFGDLHRLLEDYGFRRAGTDGFHCVYRDALGRQVTVVTVKGRKVKRPYIVRVLELLNLAGGGDDE